MQERVRDFERERRRERKGDAMKRHRRREGDKERKKMQERVRDFERER